MECGCPLPLWMRKKMRTNESKSQSRQRFAADGDVFFVK